MARQIELRVSDTNRLKQLVPCQQPGCGARYYLEILPEQCLQCFKPTGGGDIPIERERDLSHLVGQKVCRYVLV